jgi:hypothetical protein
MLYSTAVRAMRGACLRWRSNKAGAADRGPSLAPEFLSFVPGALIAPGDRGITAIRMAAVAARELR